LAVPLLDKIWLSCTLKGQNLFSHKLSQGNSIDDTLSKQLFERNQNTFKIEEWQSFQASAD